MRLEAAADDDAVIGHQGRVGRGQRVRQKRRLAGILVTGQEDRAPPENKRGGMEIKRLAR